MKKIIIIENKEISKVCDNCGEYGEGCIMKENCKKNTFNQTKCCFNFSFTPKFKIEKYPTNWTELKKLCKKYIKQSDEHWFKFETHKGIYTVTDTSQLNGYGEMTKPKFKYTIALSLFNFVETNNIVKVYGIIKNLIGKEINEKI